MEKKILVAVDGSKVSDKAMNQAVEMAKPMGAKIVAVHVIDERVITVYAETSGEPTKGVLRKFEQAGENYLEHARKIAAKQGVPVETRILRGTPCAEITEEAGKIKAELIIMGAHGMHSSTRKFIGSTAERCVRMSSVPILLVKD
ncbi:MAG: universal stress protein [Candidatus Hodarchaeota archaeon]